MLTLYGAISMKIFQQENLLYKNFTIENFQIYSISTCTYTQIHNVDYNTVYSLIDAYAGL